MPDFLFTGVITYLDLSQVSVTIDVSNQPDLITATAVGELYLSTFGNRWNRNSPVSLTVCTALARAVEV